MVLVTLWLRKGGFVLRKGALGSPLKIYKNIYVIGAVNSIVTIIRRRGSVAPLGNGT